MEELKTRRFRISPGQEHDGEGYYGVVEYTQTPDGDWVSWDDALAAIALERERCAKLADAMSHDMGELAAYIRSGRN